jgi:hypothetical protein
MGAVMRQVLQWVERRVAEQRRKLAFTNRERWLSSFDQTGCYRHWSGYWESLTGHIWAPGRGWVPPAETGCGCGYTKCVTGGPVEEGNDDE